MNNEGSRDSRDGSASGDDREEEETSDYEFMASFAEDWVGGCTASSATDADGAAVYYDTKPLPGGDVTYGVYTDASCLVESGLTWSDVVASQEEDNLPSLAALDRWNALLGDFKICQPCRAVKTRDGSSDNHSGSGSANSGDYEDGDDGEGGLERSGFNCYDDAGYQNCNKCYKFQTQKNMEAATATNLARATAQGTILAVEVEGTRYGRGHYAAPGRGARAAKKRSVGLAATLALLGLAYFYYPTELRRCWNYLRRRRRWVDDARMKASLRKGGDAADGIRVRGGEPDGALSSFLQAGRARLRRAATRLGSFFSDDASTCPTEGSYSSTEDAPAAAPEPPGRATAAATANALRENELLAAQLRERDAEISRQEGIIRELRQKLADEQLIRQLRSRLDAGQSSESANVSAFSTFSEGSAACPDTSDSNGYSSSGSYIGDSYSNADSLLEFGRKK